jgi:hypothetical protein
LSIEEKDYFNRKISRKIGVYPKLDKPDLLPSEVGGTAQKIFATTSKRFARLAHGKADGGQDKIKNLSFH